MFAIKVTGKEMRTTAPGNSVVGAEDEKYWVVIEPEGWVPATSARCDFHKDKIPRDLMTFKSAEAAEKFAAAWEGHPWWCAPKSYEIVKVDPVFVSVLDGYTTDGQSAE